MKLNFIQILIAAIILFGLGYVVRYCNEPHLPIKVPDADTTSHYLPGKPIYIPADTIIKWRDRKPAETNIDSLGEIIKSSRLDSTIIFKKDTISVSAEVKFLEGKDLFDWSLKLDYRKYDMIRVDTIKTEINNYVPVEVIKSNPLWIITSIVEGLAIILAFIFK